MTVHVLLEAILALIKHLIQFLSHVVFQFNVVFGRWRVVSKHLEYWLYNLAADFLIKVFLLKTQT